MRPSVQDEFSLQEDEIAVLGMGLDPALKTIKRIKKEANDPQSDYADLIHIDMIRSVIDDQVLFCIVAVFERSPEVCIYVPERENIDIDHGFTPLNSFNN